MLRISLDQSPNILGRRLGVQFCHDAGHFCPGRNRTHTDQICLGCRLPKTGRARVPRISELHSRPPSFSIRILLCSAQPLQGFPLGRHLRRWWLVPKGYADASFFLWLSQNGSGLLVWLWLLLLPLPSPLPMPLLGRRFKGSSRKRSTAVPAPEPGSTSMIATVW